MKRTAIVTGQPVRQQKLARAKDLRREMTEAEDLLWQHVRRNQLNGLHFRRQQVIAGFIVDFYCHAARLVVEVDGEVHRGQEPSDDERDQILIEMGLQVLRLTNQEVMHDLLRALSRIAQACGKRT